MRKVKRTCNGGTGSIFSPCVTTPSLRGTTVCFRACGRRFIATEECDAIGRAKERRYEANGCGLDPIGVRPDSFLFLHRMRAGRFLSSSARHSADRRYPRACQRGFRWYDFGEVAEEHETLTQFKTKWGGNPQPLYRYYSPASNETTSDGASPLAVVGRRIWRHLPPKATAVLGDLIYRRM